MQYIMMTSQTIKSLDQHDKINLLYPKKNKIVSDVRCRLSIYMLGLVVLFIRTDPQFIEYSVDVS